MICWDAARCDQLDTGFFAMIAFWSSLALSTMLAVVGGWRHSPALLLVGAVLSVPFAFIMSLYPGLGFFLLLPILLLLAAASVRQSFRWVSWLALVLVAGLIGWFLLFRFVWTA